MYSACPAGRLPDRKLRGPPNKEFQFFSRQLAEKSWNTALCLRRAIVTWHRRRRSAPLGVFIALRS